jgi:hypothetical protein
MSSGPHPLCLALSTPTKAAFLLQRAITLHRATFFPREGSRLVKSRRVLVRFNHIASIIVNANHGIMWTAEKLDERPAPSCYLRK